MEFLEFGHNNLLVAMSFVVAVAAGFTGLSLTKDLSSKSIAHRKISVSLAAVALGGGIWSMHFIAMLGLQLPILFFYDAAITLASALIAILIVAVALVILHFRERTPHSILGAGALVGVGILAMHYVGMAGLQLCQAVYSPAGLVISSLAAIALCILAFRIAYSNRNNRNILIGTLCFGVAVVAVHFLAMAGTNFVQVDQITEFGPSISNEVMALGVILSSFVIFGAFLWVGANLLVPAMRQNEGSDLPYSEPEPAPADEAPRVTIAVESDGNRVFVRAEDVAFVRADGHYTQVYTDTDRFFCVWPITEATKRLLVAGFLKVHRSYLVNPEKVARFERKKDNGRCIFTSDNLPPVPVSRSNLKAVQASLAPDLSASHAG